MFFSKEELKMQKILYTIPFICLCIFPAVGEDANKETAIIFIKKIVNEALNIVNNKGTSDEKKRKKLSECINRYLDIDRITKAVFSPLGYKNLSEDEKGQVRAYLKKYLIRFYAGEGKLSAMVNAALSGDPVAKPNGNDFTVTTQFKKNESPSVDIAWITDTKKVYYVEIEGINQITTLRSEMKASVGNGTLMSYINSQK